MCVCVHVRACVSACVLVRARARKRRAGRFPRYPVLRDEFCRCDGGDTDAAVACPLRLALDPLLQYLSCFKVDVRPRSEARVWRRQQCSLTGSSCYVEGLEPVPGKASSGMNNFQIHNLFTQT